MCLYSTCIWTSTNYTLARVHVCTIFIIVYMHQPIPAVNGELIVLHLQCQQSQNVLHSGRVGVADGSPTHRHRHVTCSRDVVAIAEECEKQIKTHLHHPMCAYKQIYSTKSHPFPPLPSPPLPSFLSSLLPPSLSLPPSLPPSFSPSLPHLLQSWKRA